MRSSHNRYIYPVQEFIAAAQIGLLPPLYSPDPPAPGPHAFNKFASSHHKL